MSEIKPRATNSPPPPVRRQRATPARIVPVAPSQPAQTWREYLWGPEGKSLSVSFLVHSVLLAILSIPLSQSLSRTKEIEPIFEVFEGAAGGDSLGDFIDAPVLQTGSSQGMDEFNAPRMNEGISDYVIPTNGALSDAVGTSGNEEGDGSADLAGTVGGYLLREPGNAVKAGRFTAFSRPINVVGLGTRKREEFGEPGDPPLEGQDYFIVIQIQVDKRRKSYPIGDLIGSVVGTDGYTQRFPEGVFILDDEGLPVEIKRTKPIRVVDGIVQILMRVPGAKSEVRDNIYLKSKMLREEQNLQLIFQSRSRAQPE